MRGARLSHIRNAARPSDGKLHSGGRRGRRRKRRQENRGKGDKTSEWKEEEREARVRGTLRTDTGNRSCVTRARARVSLGVRLDDVGVCRSK